MIAIVVGLAADAPPVAGAGRARYAAYGWSPASPIEVVRLRGRALGSQYTLGPAPTSRSSGERRLAHQAATAAARPAASAWRRYIAFRPAARTTFANCAADDHAPLGNGMRQPRAAEITGSLPLPE
jgi:hypothetical protein